jgi:hypothetical protein
MREVVDVVSVDARPNNDATSARCLEQAAWDLDLPDRFNEIERRAFVIDV